MQIPKISLWLGALALGVALNAIATDNPAQAAARTALESKMQEMDAQQTVPATNPPATAPSAKSENMAMKPILQKSTPNAPHISQSAAAELKAKQDAAKKEAKAKADEEAATKAAVDLKMQKEAEKKAARETANKAAADLKAKREAEKQLAAQKEAEASVAKAKAKAEKKAKKEAEAKAAADLKAQKAAIKKAAAQKQTDGATKSQMEVIKPVEVQPTSTAYPGKSLNLSPIVVPALPISASKEEQLQALLVKYQADQITPEEYHKQRAAILAAP